MPSPKRLLAFAHRLASASVYGVPAAAGLLALEGTGQFTGRHPGQLALLIGFVAALLAVVIGFLTWRLSPRNKQGLPLAIFSSVLLLIYVGMMTSHPLQDLLRRQGQAMAKIWTPDNRD